MTKEKRNSWLFVLFGTIANVLIMCTIFVVLFILDAVLFAENDNAAAVFLIVSIFVTWFSGMFIYQKLAMWVITHWHLEDKLDPLFVRRTLRKNRFDD